MKVFQIFLQLLSEFEQINQIFFHLKSSKNLWFPNEFGGSKISLIGSNLHNNLSKLWQQSLSKSTKSEAIFHKKNNMFAMKKLHA